MQSPRVPKRKNSSLRNAAILFCMIILILFMANGLRRSGLPSTLSSLLNADYENFRNLQQFDSLKSIEVQKELAGFWTYSEGVPQSSPVAKREYMELIANGMLWQINVWDIKTPSGGQSSITHVINGYVKPYSYSPDNSAFYCETRIIRQYFIADGDTCYGPSHVDEIMQIGKNQDGTLSVNRRAYKPYDGDIKEFYPDGKLLDIIDEFTMRACGGAANMPSLAKRQLARSLEAVPFFIRAQMADSLIRAYYKPIAIDELSRGYDPRGVPENMPLKLTLSPDGAVSELKYKSKGGLATKRFDDMASMDIKSWLFPPVGDSQEAQTLDLTVQVK